VRLGARGPRLMISSDSGFHTNAAQKTKVVTRKGGLVGFSRRTSIGCIAAAFRRNRHLQQLSPPHAVTVTSLLPLGPPPTCNRSRCPKEQLLLPPNSQHFARVQRIEETVQLKMSVSGSASGGAVKRQREQEEEEDAPALLETTVHPQPLMLLALVKAYFDTLVWLQLCNPQGVALFSFVQLPPRLPRPFAGAAVYDMSLTHAERLCVVGCGLKGRLVRLLSLGFGRHFEPQRNRRACHQMMQSNARRVASKRMAAVRDEAAKEAEELCASGRCAAAVVPLQRAIDFGDTTSLALKAWLLIGGREGVAEDRKRGFELAEEGARSGCHHCQGVLAWCYFDVMACKDYARSLEFARESSGRGSRYGQVTLGGLYLNGRGVLAEDDAQALAFYGLAAAQGLDEAQCSLGHMYQDGDGVAEDEAEALRLFQLAATQGHPDALYQVADCHENGWGVAADVAEAIRWYRRAQAAGHPYAADDLESLGA